MPRMTGNRYFAEAVHAYGLTHVFFVPTIMLPAMAEMEDMGIRRVVTHGEKAAAYMADAALGGTVHARAGVPSRAGARRGARGAERAGAGLAARDPRRRRRRLVRRRGRAAEAGRAAANPPGHVAERQGRAAR